MEIEYTKEQVRAAKRAAKALKELADSGLYLIWHASSGEIYCYPSSEDVPDRGYGDDVLVCGHIHEGGDW